MSEEIKTISILIMAIAMMGFAYLFYLADEIFIVLVLLFIGIVLALTLAKNATKDRKK